MKKYLVHVLIVFVLSFPVRAAAVPSYDSINTFRNLLARDNGLSLKEKEHWVFLARQQFQDTRFSFDYGRTVYQIFSQARCDEVDMARAAMVAYNSTIAIEKCGLEQEIVDLTPFAFSVDLTPDEIICYAAISRKGNCSGIPSHVTQEMIRTAKTEKWPCTTLTIFTEGLARAASEGLDVEKVALYMLISLAQDLGTPQQIVHDALINAKKRRERKESQRISGTKPAGTIPVRPRVVLDYEKFKVSIESFLGTPYLWGGNTRKGVDCSGFTKLVMEENGYTLPRVSRDQARAGAKISKKDLHLGDLLFFDTRGVGYVTHVGIYLGGNLLAHASSSKGVTLVLFSDRYFQSRFLTARRIIRYLKR